MTTMSNSASEELDAIFPVGAAFPAGTMEPEYVLNESLDPDPASVFKDVSREDRAYWDRARTFVQDDVLPVIAGYWERAEYPLHLVKRLGELDLLRDGINVDGFPAMSKTAAGLVTMELSRGDGSIGTVVAVQGGLALRSVAECGSPEQQDRWLPALSRAEEYGAFALTEPAHGSDSVGLETTATAVDGGYVLNGEKKWIGNGSIGGLTVVWARGDDGQVHGYLVPQDSPGYSATTIEGKLSLRAIWQAHIRLEDVFVPAENALPVPGVSRTQPGCSWRPGWEWPGPPSGTPLPVTKPRCSTRPNAGSSAAHWPLRRLCRSDLPGCIRSSPPCSSWSCR
ncbi:acyl-coenzyme A oxidase 4, peroxisomal [Arthrobacter sp. Hiyo1]|nr:acyl-coenzyme A oxidase 4, peroxisomal [Arthrobacter sp. Hiyo1]